MKIAIIPARGGSKRIPRKNVRPFRGRPLIEWAIEIARNSACFDRIIVSTEDKEIADISRAAGAEIPFTRPVELSDDHAGTMAVIKHALTELAKQDCVPSHVCCLYPASPLLTPRSLHSAYQQLLASNVSFCFGVVSYGHPIQRALRLGIDGRISMIDPSQALTRSQDLEPAFHDAGQFCWGTTDAFMEGISPMLQPASAIILSRNRVVDIDNEDDWELAEALHAAIMKP